MIQGVKTIKTTKACTEQVLCRLHFISLKQLNRKLFTVLLTRTSFLTRKASYHLKKGCLEYAKSIFKSVSVFLQLTSSYCSIKAVLEKLFLISVFSKSREFHLSTGKLFYPLTEMIFQISRS